jgi:site-specific recombinase XerD
MEFDNLTPLKLIEEVLANIDGAYAVNTLRAYKADMLEFNLYCCGVNACAFPATPQGVARFVQKVTLDGIKSSTVRRKVSSISALHRLGNRVDPTKNAEVGLAIRKMHRLLGRHAEQARAVNLPELEDFLKAAGSDLRGQRDCALLHLGYDTLRRRSELVSLQVEDLEFNGDDTGVVLLRKNKTDQDSKGKYLHLS